jgi:hypothetical protein
MDAVRAEALGQRHVVIDDEGDVMIAAEALQRLGEAGRLMLVDSFDAELESRDRPGREGVFQSRGEIPAHVERRDQIELARRAIAARRGGTRIGG